MTRDEQRLKKAKKLFRIGTRFTSLYGADDVVRKVEHFGKKQSSLFVSDEGDLDDGDIYAFGESGEARLIFRADTKQWADRWTKDGERKK